MSCSTCGRSAVAGECADGFVRYLSGDFPCVFNPDKTLTVRNQRALAPLSSRAGRSGDVPASEVRNNPEREDTAAGLEDLLS